MIYLDNAATTRVSKNVLDAMMPFFRESYANPSAVYQFGVRVRNAVSDARIHAARLIGAFEREIFFTSGGTESDNWAIRSAVMMGCESMRASDGSIRAHIITTPIEHHAVMHTIERLEEEKLCEVTYVEVDSCGRVNPKDIRDAIRPDTILVSVMMANNEIGTIEPVAEIGAICREKGVLFHTDAVQAFGHIPINVHNMNIDLLSASAHKIYGPKGVGLLYINERLPFRSMIQGGPQEKNRRAGTENVPGIAGFGKACEDAASTIEQRMQCESELRDYMIHRILTEIPGAVLNGPAGSGRLPGNISVCIPDLSGELMLIMLDQREICASSGSACTSGSIDPSHVLTAIGRDEESAQGALRFTLGMETTRSDVDAACDALAEIVRG